MFFIYNQILKCNITCKQMSNMGEKLTISFAEYFYIPYYITWKRNEKYKKKSETVTFYATKL